MARKKKTTRKYIPRNEFRYNNSPHTEGHPHYVFGEKGKKYMSLGLTRQPVDGIPHIKLSKNPNPDDSSPCLNISIWDFFHDGRINTCL